MPQQHQQMAHGKRISDYVSRNPKQRRDSAVLLLSLMSSLVVMRHRGCKKPYRVAGHATTVDHWLTIENMAKAQSGRCRNEINCCCLRRWRRSFLAVWHQLCRIASSRSSTSCCTRPCSTRYSGFYIHLRGPDNWVGHKVPAGHKQIRNDAMAQFECKKDLTWSLLMC
jgi:hypothetical protein